MWIYMHTHIYLDRSSVCICIHVYECTYAVIYIGTITCVFHSPGESAGTGKVLSAVLRSQQPPNATSPTDVLVAAFSCTTGFPNNSHLPPWPKCQSCLLRLIFFQEHGNTCMEKMLSCDPSFLCIEFADLKIELYLGMSKNCWFLISVVKIVRYSSQFLKFPSLLC